MVERGDFPSPEDIVRNIEHSLGLNPNAEPTWGYAEPEKRLFPEEAPTLPQRKIAEACLAELYYLVDDADSAPGFRRPPLRPFELIEAVEQFRAMAQELWGGPGPFPEIALPYLLGATKRQIIWVKELKEFEETERYNGALAVYRTIRRLLEQTLHDNFGYGHEGEDDLWSDPLPR
ncbi:MAG: hypothetical protein ACJ788_17510 [Ktedonobacteraceae bacterium]